MGAGKPVRGLQDSSCDSDPISDDREKGRV